MLKAKYKGNYDQRKNLGQKNAQNPEDFVLTIFFEIDVKKIFYRRLLSCK